MSENKKVCGISEIFSPTNNQHTRFHSANHWINMAVRSLTAIEKYLDDHDENDVCSYFFWVLSCLVSLGLLGVLGLLGLMGLMGLMGLLEKKETHET